MNWIDIQTNQIKPRSIEITDAYGNCKEKVEKVFYCSAKKRSENKVHLNCDCAPKWESQGNQCNQCKKLLWSPDE